MRRGRQAALVGVDDIRLVWHKPGSIAPRRCDICKVRLDWAYGKIITVQRDDGCMLILCGRCDDEHVALRVKQ